MYCCARGVFCCNKRQQKTPRAQQYTSLLIPCAHGKLNVKHHRTTPKRETHITSRGRSCAGEKKENRVNKKTYPIGTATTTRRTTSNISIWVELVRVCRLAVVAAAAACCSYCDNENPSPPNEARAIRREGRRAISAQLADRMVRTYHGSCLFGPRVDGAFL